MKYKIGDKIKCIKNHDSICGFTKGATFIISDINCNTYGILGASPENGWTAHFIENCDLFKLSEINNWKEVFENAQGQRNG